MNTAMLNGAQPFCSDTNARQGQADHPAYMVAGEEAAQVPLQAANDSPSTIPMDAATQTARAAPQHAACMGGA